MVAWNIRRARQQDATALSICIDAAYSIYASRIVDLPAVSSGISDDIEKNVVWVAEQNESIVGGMILIPMEEFALLANVAVDPRCAGLGLGRRLIELAESETLGLGKRELRLTTHLAMPGNVRLYAHLGWWELGRSGNKVYMTKFLAPDPL
ncbi:GNAT family N-acetyltransferase [Pelagibius sp. Alg239-R121]|uniref:GNAT family N-acetyltransferase n=1 Tax=Pelagibius sp. Alg239-R121 TaxID=2993448 RepID=UPI0024A65C9C|nr:GNAT family N-acetyltransferase [Pelagibius sp. Alg239-R121]